VLELAGQACGLLQGEFPDHSQFSAYFTQTGNHPKLDWKATTAYGTASFKELVQNQGDASEIRGEISKAEFYNAAWPETDYRCYRLISPDGETVIWGYTRRGEATEHAIASLLDKGEIVKEAQNSHKITLRLERGPTAAQANQWLIGEMLHIDWVTP
jgi:glutamate/tyrosine decarboxylase-like PLP-dependent enzyme